eukprot:782435-Pleurochrysis_carterae.AAC.1
MCDFQSICPTKPHALSCRQRASRIQLVDYAAGTPNASTLSNGVDKLRLQEIQEPAFCEIKSLL